MQYSRQEINELRNDLLSGLRNPSQAVKAAIAVDEMRIRTPSELIRAGAFKMVGIDEMAIEMSFDRIFIDEQPFRIVNLRREGKIVDLPRDNNWCVIQITGDSMDAVGIEDGDYVLLKVTAGYAENGDIVAAQIIDIDSEATLKLFENHHGSIVLRPMSHNPSYRPYEFSTQDSVRIVGVALAVFKAIVEIKRSIKAS